MAKKRPQTPSTEADRGAAGSMRILKIRVSVEELRSIRMAAAIHDERPASFVSRASLEAARKAILTELSIMGGVNLGSGPPNKRKLSDKGNSEAS
jgi:hypothetical protein